MRDTLGKTICQYRQLSGMTQDELASRLGVTPQAVSKWERGNGLPDVVILRDICEVLGVDANVMLGVSSNIVENGNLVAESEIKNIMFSEPLVLEFGMDIVPCVMEGLKTDYINEKRKMLVQRTGMIMPKLRIKDNLELQPNSYRVLSYDKVLFEASIDMPGGESFPKIVNDVVACCEKNYASIINKNIIDMMVKNLNALFPGITEDIIPEKISYLQIERKIQSYIRQGKPIKDLIHILEEMEGALSY